MKMKDLALRLAVIATVKKAATEAERATKAELLARMVDEGTDRLRPELDGTPLGPVSMANGRKSVKIVDEDAFTRWVETEHRSEMYLAVRPAFVKMLTETGQQMDDGSVVFTQTGEIVPGLAVTHGEPYLTFRGSEEGTAAIVDALGSGDLAVSLLDHNDVPELLAAEEA